MTATRDEVNSIAQSSLNNFCTGRVMMMIDGFSTGKLPAQVSTTPVGRQSHV